MFPKPYGIKKKPTKMQDGSLFPLSVLLEYTDLFLTIADPQALSEVR